MKTQSLIRHSTKRTSIKIVMLLLVILIGYGVHPTFAADGSSELISDLSSFLDKFMNIAARSRIPIATLAGKFMSNDMVYGSRFHLDKYLWQMRNISKNFANFGILAFLLFEVGKSITSKKINIQQTLGKAIIAGITIQMSWFLVAAIIDINTVATTAVGSFPSSFLGDSQAGSKMMDVIDKTIQTKTIVIDKGREGSLDTKDTQTESTDVLKEKFMPRYDSVAGPLIFIGASALNIQDMMTQKEGQSSDAKSMLVTFGLKGIILVLYMITLLLLLITNIMRVGYLWIFIAISPILILMRVFSGGDKGLGDKGLMSELKISNFLAIVFKPTIFVAVLGVILIFITSIQSILLEDNPPPINGVKISTNADTKQATIEVEGVASVTTIDKVFTDAKGIGQSVIPNLIVYLATLFLLWFLVKISLSSGKDPIAGVMKKGTDFIEKSAQTTPLMNGLSYKSMQKVSEQSLNKVGEEAGFENLGNYKRSDRGAMQNKDFEDKLRGILGGTIEWKPKDLEVLQKSIKEKKDFLAETKAIMTEDHEGLTGTSTFYQSSWEKEFINWLKSTDKTYTKLSNDYKNITTLNDITSKDDWKQIHIRLGGDETKAPTNYTEFKQKKYGNIR